MLHRLQGFARWLRPARPLLVALGLLAFALATYLVLFGDPQTSDPLLLPAILGLLWCLCAVVFISTFETVPPAPPADVTGLSRLKRRVARLWYSLLALAFLGLTVAALLLTNRLLGEALG
ncbi:hypothetical protein [uncultured Thiohalocapsa sp.]|jgi:hypothetical protein|uniref:hypothetical protein n=1 Tax=uncultured Thiohalocapsa sp. TaxID=768990 RepID=UPI0025D96D2D|nr:hypothetical protein [uncultured Thiohalocapsa sp.]